MENLADVIRGFENKIAWAVDIIELDMIFADMTILHVNGDIPTEEYKKLEDEHWISREEKISGKSN